MRSVLQRIEYAPVVSRCLSNTMPLYKPIKLLAKKLDFSYKFKEVGING